MANNDRQKNKGRFAGVPLAVMDNPSYISLSFSARALLYEIAKQYNTTSNYKAALKAMESAGFSLEKQVTYVAGHSLGEYSALCAAGALSISDTARLLRIRGEDMQAAVPVGKSAMAAIIGL